MFILTLADYEGEVVLGVYSSRELAEAASEAFDAQRTIYDFENFVVREIVLDAPAEYHF